MPIFWLFGFRQCDLDGARRENMEARKELDRKLRDAKEDNVIIRLSRDTLSKLGSGDGAAGLIGG